MGRDQYQDQNNPKHNVTAQDLYRANGNAVINERKEFVAYRVPEFQSNGSINIDGCQPAPEGSTSPADVTRLMAAGRTEDPHHVGSPAAVQVLVDNMDDPQFPDTTDPNGPWEWASDYL